ncbi:MAG: hypothetical protein AAGB35_07080 [Pseudomonadota bacterium]
MKGPNTIKDLHYGEVLFNYYQNDYFTAITHLMAFQQLNRVSNHRPDDELLLGGIQVSYGMHNEAGKLFAKILEENEDDAIKNRAYYYLAKISYQRGYLNIATNYINNVKGAVHEDIFNDVKMLKSQIYLDSGDPEKAIASLDNWRPPKDYRSYAMHNLGIAHIRNGNIEEGISQLKSSSKQKVRDDSLLNLRDKSNLVAGLSLLNNNPDKAQSYLENVSLDGIYSDISLLTMGWAYSEQGEHEKALTPWLELRNRRLTTTPVQEGLLAIAYGYGQLGLNGRAAKSYEDALALYQVEDTNLSESINSIKQGKLVGALIEKADDPKSLGWFWSLKSIPEIPEARYLSELMANHQFHEAVKNFRDIIFLQENLRAWLENIEVYNSMLKAREQRYQKHTPAADKAIKQSQLNRFKKRYQQYVEEFKLAKDNHLLTLANDNEISQIRRINDLKKKINWLQEEGYDQKELAEISSRIGIAEGVITWKIHTEYAQRLWDLDSNISELASVIEGLSKSEDSIKNVRQVAHVGFDGFQYRINEIKQRIENVLPRLNIAYKKQSKLLEKLAVRELIERKHTMKTYRAQAKLALSQAYDRATVKQKDNVVEVQE